MALVDDFKARFPNDFSEEIVDQFIPILEPVYPVYFVGDYTVALDKEAILNLLAHLLTLETSAGAGAAGASGAVASKSVGSVSVSYAVPSTLSEFKSFFAGTKYGQRFLAVIQGRGGAGVFV